MVGNSFFKYGVYSVPNNIIDEVVSDVVVSLNKIFNEKLYDPKKSRFRSYLKTICDRRVVDYLRKNVDNFKTDSIDEDGGEVFCSVDEEEELVAVYDRFMEQLFGDEDNDEGAEE